MNKNKNILIILVFYFGLFFLFNMLWIIGFLLCYSALNTLYLDINYPDNVQYFVLGMLATLGILSILGSIRVLIFFFQEKLYLGLFSTKRMEWNISKWMKQYNEFGPITKGLAITSILDMIESDPRSKK